MFEKKIYIYVYRKVNISSDPLKINTQKTVFGNKMNFWGFLRDLKHTKFFRILLSHSITVWIETFVKG